MPTGHAPTLHPEASRETLNTPQSQPLKSAKLAGFRPQTLDREAPSYPRATTPLIKSAKENYAILNHERPTESTPG